MTSEHPAPPAPPETASPVMPGVGTVDSPAPGTEGPVEEDDQEIDPHPDTPDDFDDDVAGDRESVETVIEKD